MKGNKGQFGRNFQDWKLNTGKIAKMDSIIGVYRLDDL